MCVPAGDGGESSPLPGCSSPGTTGSFGVALAPRDPDLSHCRLLAFQASPHSETRREDTECPSAGEPPAWCVMGARERGFPVRE